MVDRPRRETPGINEGGITRTAVSAFAVRKEDKGMKTHTAGKILSWSAVLLAVIASTSVCTGPKGVDPRCNLTFGISFSPDRSSEALDGRMLLLISNDDSREPRFQINDNADSQVVFGVDVEGLQPGSEAVFDHSVFGYPVRSIADIPAGEYSVQGLLHRYETCTLATGHTVKLPMDRGEGQKWNRAPGNLYSEPQKIRIDPQSTDRIHIVLENEIAPIPDPPETRYIKHVRIQSKLLTEFWGRPMFLGAHILVPHGFDDHPEARYPLVINHGHFPYDFSGFREKPPDPNLKPDYSERFHWEGYNITQQEYAYKFYQYWTAPDTPRMLLIMIQHATPYYDDSYAVNSASQGPWGDAVMTELVPYIEEKFRGIGEGWARFTYGGSTGGWEALGAQVFYPDSFNGCFAACPDSITFKAFFIVNLYEHKNAYYLDSQWKKTPRPGTRNWLGQLNCTHEDINHKELALGSKGRSGGQWDIYSAVYSPQGEDGYPKPIWNKLTGEIDPEVAAYWRENYDLGYIMERDWKTLGPKLQGKIHIYCGDMDNYYLNNAVYLVEDFLESTKDPYYDGVVDYGDRAEHCWNGDHEQPNAISRLRYQQMYAPIMVKRMLESHPEGADLTSWRY